MLLYKVRSVKVDIEAESVDKANKMGGIDTTSSEAKGTCLEEVFSLRADKLITMIYNEMNHDYDLELFRNYMYERLRFKDGNDLLNCRMYNDNINFEVRTKILTGKEFILGNYLLYYSIGHQGIEIVQKFENEKEIEKALLGNDGADNPFITSLVVFKNGKVKKFKIVKEKVNNTAMKNGENIRKIKWTS